MINTIIQPPQITDLTFIPLSWEDTNISQYSNYKYITNIVYNYTSVSTIQPISYNNIIYTECLYTNHPFKKGQTIYIESGRDEYNGYVTILDIQTNSFTINIPYTAALVSPDIIECYNFNKFKQPANENGQCELDLSKIIKNKVSSTHPSIYNQLNDSNSTFIQWNIRRGAEYDYIYNFDDNYFINGNLGLIKYNYTVSQVKLNVGDGITIEQQIHSETSSSIAQSTSNPGYIRVQLTSGQPFLAGQQVTLVNSSISSYNGVWTILEATTSYIDLSAVYVGSSTATVSIYGIPRPEYNGYTYILDIVQVGSDVVIEVHKGFTSNTPPIPGVLKPVKNIKTYTPFPSASIGVLYTLNGIQKEEYDQFFAYNYAFKIGQLNDNKLATYLDPTQIHTIKYDNKAFINSIGLSLYTINYKAYTSGVMTAEFELTPTSENNYIPLNINDIQTIPTFTLISGGITGNEDYMEMKIYNGTYQSYVYKFRLNNDCIDTEVIFRDTLSSYISLQITYQYRESLNRKADSVQHNQIVFENGVPVNKQKINEIYNVIGTTVYTLYTGFIHKNDIIKELYLTDEMYVYIDGIRYNCELIDGSVKLIDTNITGELGKYEIKIKLNKRIYK